MDSDLEKKKEAQNRSKSKCKGTIKIRSLSTWMLPCCRSLRTSSVVKTNQTTFVSSIDFRLSVRLPHRRFESTFCRLLTSFQYRQNYVERFLHDPDMSAAGMCATCLWKGLKFLTHIFLFFFFFFCSLLFSMYNLD